MKLKIILSMLIILIFSGCSNLAVNNFPEDENGNIEVAIQDQFTEIVDYRMSQLVNNITLLADYPRDTSYINVSSTSLPTIEQEVELNHFHRFYQAEILNVTSLGGNNYQLLLDKPLSDDFNTSSPAQLVITDWAISGTMANPVIFDISPRDLLNVSWDVTRVILTCIGDGAGISNDEPDLSTFFTMSAITNGVLFRMVDGEIYNIFNAKDNFHLNSEAYDLIIYPASKRGFFGVAVRRSFNGADKNGVTIRLTSEGADTFQLMVRDDLTDMEECHAVVQGHYISR